MCQKKQLNIRIVEAKTPQDQAVQQYMNCFLSGSKRQI